MYSKAMRTSTMFVFYAMLCFSPVFTRTIEQGLDNFDWSDWNSLPAGNDSEWEEELFKNLTLIPSSKYIFPSPPLGASRVPEFYAAKCDRSDLCSSLSHFPVCHCDEECFKIGDCCLERVNNHTSAAIDLFSSIWQCLPLFINENLAQEQVFAYVIGKCPKDSDEILASMCSRQYGGPKNIYDHLIDVPVFSRNTSVWYANIFCAVCNQDVNNLTSWNVDIRCDTQLVKNDLSHLVLSGKARYISGERKWILNGTNHQCRLYVEELASSSGFIESIGIRQCFQSIGDCTSDWHNVEDGQKCKSYTAYVETHLDGKLKVFKNWHCALCNGVPRDQIHCYGIIFRDLEDNMSPPLNYHSIKEVRSNSGEACKDNQVFDFVLHERCHSFSHLSDGHTSSTEKILLVDETDKSKKFPAVKNGDGNVSNCAPRTVIHQVFVVITIMFLCFCKESISRQEVA